MVKSLKRKRGANELAGLEQRVQNLDIQDLDQIAFDQLPLSQATLNGLGASHYKTLTDVQQRAIPPGLKGADVLGAAKTGSGKTLAFLIPVLENLHRKAWNENDGLGALIVSPTRDLAIQIFEVLRRIGRYHTFSAGLIIGGKSLEEERIRMSRMNILICTPGRMLQHLDQTVLFEATNLQMLVLDEADRILDMGFQATIDAIVEHVPKQRQTLLFSATQTRRVSDLARLSLHAPEYISIHEEASSATPTRLQQHYVMTPLPEKLDTLWGFLRTNLKAKILVFMSSTKQVRFVYEALRQMQPGIPLMHLYGRQKQAARLDVVGRFSASKASCLISTDVAARGLDFPAVDWVIQLDCPEDAETYIHRVGRTARFERNGRAVLFLDPSEEAILNRLEQHRVHVEKIQVRQKKQQSITNQLQNMCFKDTELRYLGQKAFISYVRSIRAQKDKEVFQLGKLSLTEFSASLGLPGPPRIKFAHDDVVEAQARKNAPRQWRQGTESPEPQNGIRTKYDRMFERKNQGVLANHYTKLVERTPMPSQAGDNEADFLSTKRMLNGPSSHNDSDSESDSEIARPATKVVTGVTKDPLLIDSRRREKLLRSKKKLTKFKERGKKLIYDADGVAHEIYELEDEEKFKSRGPADAQTIAFREVEQGRLQAADTDDKAFAKAKRKEKRQRRKLNDRNENEIREPTSVQLATVESDELEASSIQDLSDASLGAKQNAAMTDTRSRKLPHKGWQAKSVEDGDESLTSLEAMASGLLA